MALKLKTASSLNIYKEFQYLVGTALGKQVILKPPEGGFSFAISFGLLACFPC